MGAYGCIFACVCVYACTFGNRHINVVRSEVTCHAPHSSSIQEEQERLAEQMRVKNILQLLHNQDQGAIPSHLTPPGTACSRGSRVSLGLGDTRKNHRASAIMRACSRLARSHSQYSRPYNFASYTFYPSLCNTHTLFCLDTNRSKFSEECRPQRVQQERDEY